MNSLTAGIRTTVRIGLCVLVVAVAVLALGRDGQPASATEPTKIFLSTSNFSPIPLPSGIILFPNGPKKTLYVWAEDVVSERGAGSFRIDFHYLSWLLATNEYEADPEWLSVSGTQVVTCDPVTIIEDLETGQATVTVGCTILGAPSQPPAPPWGALGTGVLAEISISPGSALWPDTTMTMTTDTRLFDTGEEIDENGDTVIDPEGFPQEIPTKLTSLNIKITPCADFTGAVFGVPDGVVTVVDILFEASHFGATPSHPDWEADWDMNGDEFVNIFDILIVGRQFGSVCP